MENKVIKGVFEVKHFEIQIGVKCWEMVRDYHKTLTGILTETILANLFVKEIPPTFANFCLQWSDNKSLCFSANYNGVNVGGYYNNEEKQLIVCVDYASVVFCSYKNNI